MSGSGPVASVAGAGNGDTGGSGPAKVSTTASTPPSRSLLQQLPSGAVLAFQALAGTFTNQGDCHRSNLWLTVGLVTILSSTCIFFSFTDSVAYKGKIYYGVAVPGRLNILNMHKREEIIFFKELRPQLRKLGLTPVDWVHAFLSLVVFLTIAGSDVGLQKCFFPKATDDTQQLLKNLPLGTAVMSTFLFMIFPTTRKGIRFDNSTNALPEENKSNADDKTPAGGDEEAAGGKDGKKTDTDKAQGVMSSTSLLQLLPSGPVLAFQTLIASFTNQGKCLHSNWWLTFGLVVFLSATCIFSSFTDCVLDLETRKPHWGVALPSRLHIIGMPVREQATKFNRRELKARRLKTVDWIHAFFAAVVFLTIAGSDVGLQDCFFPNANEDTKQVLKNLPLGMAVLSSFVFVVFPSTRNSMCFDDSEMKPDDSNNSDQQKNPAANAPRP